MASVPEATKLALANYSNTDLANYIKAMKATIDNLQVAMDRNPVLKVTLDPMLDVMAECWQYAAKL